jgi:surface carbohydrate biosynthesis protein
MIIPHLTQPFNCDVLIYDIPGSTWLHKCIPESASYKVFNIRHDRPLFIDARFLVSLIRHYLNFSRQIPNRRFLSYVFSILDTIRPRVILTFADNNIVLGEYAKYSPDTLVVSIQNAIRGTVDSIPPNTRLPIYYSLGHAEREVFKEIGVTFEEYLPVGSVKLGLFLEDRKQTDLLWNLSFCSHYRPELLNKDASPLFQLIEGAHRHLFQLACKYARKRGLSMAVLSKTREAELQAMEEEYFSSLSDGYPFTLISGNKLDREFATYEGAFTSELVVNLCSTLGYEAFGAGRKVLFGSGYRADLLEDWGAVQYYERLPDQVSLQDDTLLEFSQKADALRTMDSAIYKAITQDAATHYMTLPHNQFPHDVIRERLASHLAQD